MFETTVHESIHAIGQRDWNSLFADQIEDFGYLAAVEGAALPGFRLRYLVVRRGSRPVAAAPLFLTDYALETTLAGAGRRIVAQLRQRAPQVLTLPLACLGSPCTEVLPLGLDAGLDQGQRTQALSALLDQFAHSADGAGARLLAMKDVAAGEHDAFRAQLDGRGYRSISGLPVACLDIRFHSIDAYLAGLGSGTRRDMRRKLRAASGIRVEIVTDIAPHLDAVLALYRQTRNRAQLQFEELTPEFFAGVAGSKPGAAFYVLYWHGSRLLAFNLLLQDRDTLLDKFFCMDAGAGRDFNLYFVSWFTNVGLCLERGLVQYQSGQAGYNDKLRLGCRLLRTTLHYRHRNPVAQLLLRLAAPMLAADPVGAEAA